MAIFSLTGILQDAATRASRMPMILGDEYDTFARATLATRTSRSSLMQRTTETDWLFAQLESVVQLANRTYGFALDGLETFANIVQYDVGSELEWHSDTGEGVTRKSVRKISVSVQLSEPSSYEGGELEFAAYPADPFSKVLGTAIVFPSYAAHRVCRVTSGRRLALVAFAHGPQFK